jgi:hypothetical protein
MDFVTIHRHERTLDITGFEALDRIRIQIAIYPFTMFLAKVGNVCYSV